MAFSQLLAQRNAKVAQLLTQGTFASGQNILKGVIRMQPNKLAQPATTVILQLFRL